MILQEVVMDYMICVKKMEVFPDFKKEFTFS